MGGEDLQVDVRRVPLRDGHVLRRSERAGGHRCLARVSSWEFSAHRSGQGTRIPNAMVASKNKKKARIISTSGGLLRGLQTDAFRAFTLILFFAIFSYFEFACLFSLPTAHVLF